MRKFGRSKPSTNVRARPWNSLSAMSARVAGSAVAVNATTWRTPNGSRSAPSRR